jgi:hypothetical protein
MNEDQLTITELVALYGAYLKNGGQGLKDISKKIFAPTKTEKLFFRIPTTDTVIDKANYMLSEVLQSNQNKFVHKGSQTFVPERIILEQLMIDYAETPNKIVQSWIGFLANAELDPKAAPIVRWTIENLINQAAEDYEKNLYSAKKLPIVDGVATPTSASFDGLKEKFKGYNTRGVLQVNSLGAPPAPGTLNAGRLMVEYVREFVLDILPEYRGEMEFVAGSEENARIYNEGCQEVYNTYYAKVKIDQTPGDIVDTPIFGTSLMYKGLRSHLGTDAMWATIKNNNVIGVKNGQNEGNFIVGVKDNKLVQISTNYWKGLGFSNPRWLFHNGQDLV